jgi:hypothetical protein
MPTSLDQVIADPVFNKHASAMRAAIPKGPVQSLDGVFEHVQRFAAVRRREVRVSLLQEAGRAGASDWQSHRERVPDAVGALGTAMKTLSDHAHGFKSLISPKLDEVIALASAENHPLHQMILDRAVSLGFTREEAGWLFSELEAIKYRPVQLLCADGFDDLAALIASISVGEGGLLLAGFARFTDDPEIDKRLEKIIIRLREQGVTASIFLVLVIVITAHAVASHSQKSR